MYIYAHIWLYICICLYVFKRTQAVWKKAWMLTFNSACCLHIVATKNVSDMTKCSWTYSSRHVSLTRALQR